MATSTNAIATELEVKTKTGSSASVTTNLCCTKSRAITLGVNSSLLGNYANNLLIKYQDIIETLTYSPNMHLRIIADVDYTRMVQYYKDLYFLVSVTWIRGNSGRVTKETKISVKEQYIATRGYEGYSDYYSLYKSCVTNPWAPDYGPKGYIGVTSTPIYSAYGGMNSSLNGTITHPGQDLTLSKSLSYLETECPWSNTDPLRVKIAISLYGTNRDVQQSGTAGDTLIKSFDTSQVVAYSGDIINEYSSGSSGSYDGPYEIGYLNPSFYFVIFENQTVANAFAEYNISLVNLS